MRTRPKVIAVTMGDPRGIGPEIIVKALGGASFKDARFVVIGDDDVLRSKVQGLKSKVGRKKVKSVPNPETAAVSRESLNVFSIKDPTQCVKQAAEWALAGRVDAVVTAPLYKKAFGIFGGHTEYLAHLAGVRRVVMMLTGGGLRVALVTTHLPFRRILPALTPQRIFETIKITQQSLKDHFGIDRPRLALAGLNPHAGEGGLLGREELDLFPRVKRLCRGLRSVEVSGPHPPDAVFYQARQGCYDAVVALYHDQGLIAVKTLAFEEGVNVTLGLPFIRTSPDHGTARDIAGKNIASPRSMIAALDLAVMLAAKSRPANLKG